MLAVHGLDNVLEEELLVVVGMRLIRKELVVVFLLYQVAELTQLYDRVLVHPLHCAGVLLYLRDYFVHVNGQNLRGRLVCIRLLNGLHVHLIALFQYLGSYRWNRLCFSSSLLEFGVHILRNGI